MLFLRVKNVAHSRKYIGEPVLKVLTFKSMRVFHSYRDEKWQNREEHCPYRRFIGTSWPDLFGQRSPAPGSLNKQLHPSFTLPLTTEWPSSPLLGTYLRRPYSKRHVFSTLHAALFSLARTRKHLNVHRQMNGLKKDAAHIYTKEY